LRTEKSIQDKIVTLEDLKRKIERWRLLTRTVAFTNGCFDILHAGHIASLVEASNQGDVLVVAVNADSSVKKLKGENRPINNAQDRALVLASLSFVDAVIIFEEDTPRDIIVATKPDVLVKGGDYTPDQIAGAKEVQAYGGRVMINKLVDGFSTSGLIEKIQKQDNS
jgi:D-glycero-beta-D-manno-heptose 1-phosphate adenylyltransferase